MLPRWQVAGGFVTGQLEVSLDHWVTRWLDSNPTGTVVEVGSGLNTRYERIDNGTARSLTSPWPVFAVGSQSSRRCSALIAQSRLVEWRGWPDLEPAEGS
jgi:hypothetical protein